MLTPPEQKACAEAKEAEIQSWLKTGTVSKILRSKLDPEQILKCRWILTWKPREDEKMKAMSEGGSKLKSHKPKARLVVLEYMDPQITEVPRDSPTLGKRSKMIILRDGVWVPLTSKPHSYRGSLERIVSLVWTP